MLCFWCIISGSRRGPKVLWLRRMNRLLRAFFSSDFRLTCPDLNVWQWHHAERFSPWQIIAATLTGVYAFRHMDKLVGLHGACSDFAQALHKPYATYSSGPSSASGEDRSTLSCNHYFLIYSQYNLVFTSILACSVDYHGFRRGLCHRYVHSDEMATGYMLCIILILLFLAQ